MDKLKGISQTYVKCYNGEIIHSMQLLPPCPCRGRAVNRALFISRRGRGRPFRKGWGVLVATETQLKKAMKITHLRMTY